MKVKHAMWLAAAMATGSLFAESGFSYQGRLVDEYGKPKTNAEAVVFSIYAQRSGGTSLWAKQQAVTPSANGTFNVELSGVGRGDSPRELSEVIASTPECYLEVSFEENGTVAAVVTPRQKILPVPSALYAQNVSEARGDFVVRGTTRFYGDVLFYRSVSQGALPDLQVAEGTLTTRDLVVNGAVKTGGDGVFNNDVTVQGDLEINGNVTLKSSQGGTTFKAENTDFTVKSLEIVGGELKVNGLNPGVPTGVISMWSGSVDTVPDGWAVCDGSNGTPDLTGRFVVGAGSSVNSAKANDGGQAYAKGATGGAREVKLTLEQMPKHYHEYFGDDQLDTHATRVRDQGGYDADSERSGSSAWFKTTETGGNSSGTAAHENLPPYYALFYIMKVK